MQQYYYRSSHRERFSSLQIGKVCPGRGLCNEDLEWCLLLLDVFGAQILGFLLLPIFTLDHKNSKIKKQIQMRNLKKFKKEEN
jgi:hypothetical protein